MPTAREGHAVHRRISAPTLADSIRPRRAVAFDAPGRVFLCGTLAAHPIGLFALPQALHLPLVEIGGGHGAFALLAYQRFDCSRRCGIITTHASAGNPAAVNQRVFFMVALVSGSLALPASGPRSRCIAAILHQRRFGRSSAMSAAPPSAAVQRASISDAMCHAVGVAPYSRQRD